MNRQNMSWKTGTNTVQNNWRNRGKSTGNWYTVYLCSSVYILIYLFVVSSIGGGSIPKVGTGQARFDLYPLLGNFFSFQSANGVFWGTLAHFLDVNIHY